MTYYVEIRSSETHDTEESVLKTTSHFKACQKVNEYNKEYGSGAELLKKYPKSQYYIHMRHKP